MSVQDTYKLKPYPYYDGGILDMHSGTRVSRTVETTEIPFGRVVSAGSTPDKIVLGGELDISGITVRKLDQEGGIPQVGARVSVCKDGFLSCVVDGAGSKGDELHVESATGRLTTAVLSGTVIVAIPNGTVVLGVDKDDNADEEDNIVPVQIMNIVEV